MPILVTQSDYNESKYDHLPSFWNKQQKILQFAFGVEKGLAKHARSQVRIGHALGTRLLGKNFATYFKRANVVKVTTKQISDIAQPTYVSKLRASI